MPWPPEVLPSPPFAVPMVLEMIFMAVPKMPLPPRLPLPPVAFVMAALSEMVSMLLLRMP